MQYSPPPLFKQGASARVKVVFFSVFAILLLLIDARLNALVLVRQVVGTTLYPVQMIAVMPRDAVLRIADYLFSASSMEKENAKLKKQQAVNAVTLQQTGQLVTENDYLRKLLDARARIQTESILGEIIYDARDPFSRKIILDKGIKHGVALSQPVIDNLGVVGQVTRVFPLTAEVTLLTDKTQAIPVQIIRNGLRSVAYGRGGSAMLDMRMTSNADVLKGDILVTSGIDGVYPAGLAVAKVVQVESKAMTPFENILCEPTAGIDRHRQLLILLVSPNSLARPDTEEVRAKKEKINRKVTRDGLKDAGKEPTASVAPTLPQTTVAASAAAASVPANSATRNLPTPSAPAPAMTPTPASASMPTTSVKPPTTPAVRTEVKR